MTLLDFEKEVAESYSPQNLSPEFRTALYQRLTKPLQKARGITWGWALRAVPAMIALLIVTAVLIIGPGKVWAQVQLWLGMVPGLGLLDPNSPVMVLGNSVSQTRDGVTVEIVSVTATDTKTVLDYRIIGVPRNAYGDEGTPFECQGKAFLLTPRGDRLESTSDRNTFPPLPAKTTAASLNLPCLPETRQNTVPVDWTIPFTLKAGALESIAMPPIEANGMATSAPPSLAPEITPVDTLKVNEPLQVLRVFQTETSYVLAGAIPLREGQALWQGYYTARLPRVLDAHQQWVPVSEPENRRDLMDLLSAEIAAGAQPWMLELPASIAFPVTITWDIQLLTAPLDGVAASFEFDSATIPDPGNELILDQALTLGKDDLTLHAIRRTAQGIYEFQMVTPPAMASLDIAITGIPANWFGTARNGTILTLTPFYFTAPEGLIQVELSRPVYYAENITYSGQWSPGASVEQASGAYSLPNCQMRPPFPPIQDSLLQGKLLFTEPMASTGSMGVVLYDLDGSNREVLSDNGFWGQFSPDGSRIAYAAQDGLHLFDLAAQTDQTILNTHGYDLRWSPDGQWIAYINTDPQTGISINIVRPDGSGLQVLDQHQQLKMADWLTADGKLYYTKHYLPENKSQTLHSFDPATGGLDDLGNLPEWASVYSNSEGNALLMDTAEQGKVYTYDLTARQFEQIAVQDELYPDHGRAGWLWSRIWEGDPYQQADYALVDYERCQAWQLEYEVIGGSLTDFFLESK